MPSFPTMAALTAPPAGTQPAGSLSPLSATASLAPVQQQQHYSPAMGDRYGQMDLLFGAPQSQPLPQPVVPMRAAAAAPMSFGYVPPQMQYAYGGMPMGMGMGGMPMAAGMYYTQGPAPPQQPQAPAAFSGMSAPQQQQQAVWSIGPPSPIPTTFPAPVAAPTTFTAVPQTATPPRGTGFNTGKPQ